MIHAIVLIHTNAHSIPETAQALAGLDGISQVYSCAGDVDLIALLHVSTHDQIAAVVTEGINKVAGVLKTTTHIAFREYSNADVEAGFSIGE